MAILHGSWLIKDRGSCLFIWGETWRTLGSDASRSSSFTEVRQHPLAMTPVELFEWLRSRNITLEALNTTSPQNGQKITENGRRRKSTETAINLPTHSQIIALPTCIQNDAHEESLSISPTHSATFETDGNDTPKYLQPWKVEGFCLNSEAATKFLTSLPLNISDETSQFLGGDLRFGDKFLAGVWISFLAVSFCLYFNSNQIILQSLNGKLS